MQNQKSQQSEELAQQILIMEQVLRTRLSRDALLRYSNIKAANPNQAFNVLVGTIKVLEQINQNINDDEFKEIIRDLNPKKRNITIKRK